MESDGTTPFGTRCRAIGEPAKPVCFGGATSANQSLCVADRNGMLPQHSFFLTTPMHHVTHFDAPAAPPITFEQFLAVDVRLGTVTSAEPYPEARMPSLKLTIDFGPTIGLKRSSARITEHYTPESLVGRQIAAVVNFPPRQIGKFMSEVLTLGFPDLTGDVVLFRPDQSLPNGARLF